MEAHTVNQCALFSQCIFCAMKPAINVSIVHMCHMWGKTKLRIDSEMFRINSESLKREMRCIRESIYSPTPNIYIYILVLSKLARFSFTRSNYLTPLTQGRSLGLATPLITAVSVCFFLTRSAFIQSQNVFTITSIRRRFRLALQLHFSGRRESNKHGKRRAL